MLIVGELIQCVLIDSSPDLPKEKPAQPLWSCSSPCTPSRKSLQEAGYHNIHCFYQNKGNSRVKKLHTRIWLIFRARKIMSIKQQILFYITIFWKCTCCVKNLLKGCVLQMFYKLQKSFGLWLQNIWYSFIWQLKNRK